MESTKDNKEVITTSNDKNNEPVVENNLPVKTVKKPLLKPVIEKTKQQNTVKADTELNTEKVEKQPVVSKKKIPRAKKEVQIPLRKSSRLRNKQTD
ncbi:hypothetical protein ACO0SA_004235 [Hanseniaspora valbyensis]